MNKFKAGDKVKCVDADFCARPFLTLGKIYTVSQDLPEGDWMRLEGVENPFTAWNYSRFEHVPATEFIINGSSMLFISQDEAEQYVMHSGFYTDGQTAEIAQVTRRVVVKRTTTVSLEDAQ